MLYKKKIEGKKDKLNDTLYDELCNDAAKQLWTVLNDAEEKYQQERMEIYYEKWQKESSNEKE